MSINRNSLSKYVLITGAPGSRWSWVAKSIYWSNDVDRSDYSEDRTYNGPGHQGAYWDPGMEFDTLDWDGPFSGEGVRIIKSHTFAHHLNYLKAQGQPIVMVVRNDYECMKWWLEAGGWDITYPNYKPYYKDDATMFRRIQDQNLDIHKFMWDNKDKVVEVFDNYHLADLLGLSLEGIESRTYYNSKDTKVYVYRPKTN